MSPGRSRCAEWVAIGLVAGFWAAGCAAETPDLGSKPEPRPTGSTPGIAFPVPPEAGSSSEDSEGPSGPHGSSPDPSIPSLTPEPLRDPALTFVNGVIDARFVQLCEVDPETGLPSADEVPHPEGGLAFGASLVFTPDGPLGYLWSEDPRSLLLIASQRPIESGLSCSELVALARRSEPVGPNCGAALELPFDAGPSVRDASAVLDVAVWDAAVADAAVADAPVPLDASLPGSRDAAAEPSDDADAGTPSLCLPALRAAPFATFPKGTFTRELSLLLVASGCVGGGRLPAAGACGVDFDRARSSLMPVVVPLSRLFDYRALGLQFVNASVLPKATLRSDPGMAEGGAYFTLATDLPRGAIAPERLRSGVDRASLGEPLDRVELHIEERSGTDPLLVTTWAEVAPVEASLHNGSGWSFVLLGSAAGDDRELAGLKLLLLENDPDR